MKPDLPKISTRRDWIRTAGATAVLAATPGWLLAGPVINPIEVPPAASTLELLDMSLAQSCLGHEFEVVSADGYAVCKLAKVIPLGNPRIESRMRKAFAMEFHPISSQGTLQQDVYQIRHPVLGTFDLLLVPHTNARGNSVLVATFSRL